MTRSLLSEEDIFQVARRIEAGEVRDAYLGQVCGEDVVLRKQLDELLRPHDESQSFLESPASEIERGTSGLPTIDQPPLEKLGTLIGRYKLLEQVGEGGMGVVYVAEQTEPVRRRVALKIIKPGMDTKQVIARFEAERQALAMMDHPNIAKVLDAGTTEAGRPYFVMELVRGMPITEYCDKVRLSPRQRLELFVDVCHATQHAHQKGIIHRDLKPSNVLITLHDGTPVVKVIDFGVAKAVGQQLTERTVYTALTQLVGTPLYMSPEQAEMSGLDVDTRSDVYSLGVLLYELLTGQTPFDKETLAKAGLDEMRRIIREDEPLRPSRRFSTLGVAAISTASQHRGVDERRLSKILRGELDWIVMKALEKDRSRRYESASALATDIQRYLSDEPVLACPPTTMYRFQKFARKHKPALATAAAIGLCLILGTTVSAWQAARATTAEAQANVNEAQAKEAAAAEAQQRQRAEANEQQAKTQRDEVKAVNDQLQRTLYALNMNLAKTAWDQSAVSRMESLLEQYRPKPGESDLRGFEWHYLTRLGHAKPRVKLRGSGGVYFSPDGKHLVSSNGAYRSWGNPVDPELKMWDIETGQELFSRKGSDTGVVFSPDGKRIAAGVATWEDKADMSKWLTTTEAKVWDSQTGAELLILKGHTGNVVALAYSLDGKHLVTGSKAGQGKVGELKIWDAITGRELQSLSGNIESVAFSPDNKRLAYGTGGDVIDGKGVKAVVNVLDAETGQQLLQIHDGAPWVSYSPNGKLIAGASYSWDTAKRAYAGGMVKVWNAQSGEEVRGLSEKSDGEIQFAFSPDGKRIATAGQRARVPRVKVCDTETGEELFTFQQHRDAINKLAFSPDSKWLASSSADETVRIWDLTNGQEIQTLKRVGTSSLAFSPDGKQLATSGGSVRIWDLQKASNPRTFNTEGIQGTISSDLKQFAVASRAFRDTPPVKEVMIWDEKSGQQTKALTGHTNMIFGIAFSPDGQRLASADGNLPGAPPPLGPTLVKIWDLKTGQELLTLKGHTSKSVRHLAFSPDGKRLATRGHGGPGQPTGLGGKSELKMWDAQTGQELFTLDLVPKVRQVYYGTNVFFSPDGKRFATGIAPEVKIFSTQDGAELLSIPDGGQAIAFSPDGKRLASGTSGFKIWDAETGSELVSSRTDTSIRALAFSPDGDRLASASRDGTVTLWDAHSGDQTLTFEYSGDREYSGAGATEQSHDIAFSADGHRLASVLWDGTVRIWDATPLPETP